MLLLIIIISTYLWWLQTEKFFSHTTSKQVFLTESFVCFTTRDHCQLSRNQKQNTHWQTNRKNDETVMMIQSIGITRRILRLFFQRKKKKNTKWRHSFISNILILFWFAKKNFLLACCYFNVFNNFIFG